MTAALEGGEWSAACPSRTLPQERLVPILQEAGWAPGPVWTGGKSRPHRNSIPVGAIRLLIMGRMGMLDLCHFSYVFSIGVKVSSGLSILFCVFL